jgi:hypothetical protein
MSNRPALDVADVLEQEYVSMYGPLSAPPPTITPDDIIDAECVRGRLRGYLKTSAFDLATIQELDHVKDCGALKQLVADYLTLLCVSDNRRASAAFVFRNAPVLSPQTSERIRDVATDALYKDLDSGERQRLNRQIIDEVFIDGGVRSYAAKRTASVYAKLHARAKNESKFRTALCISGGGIRSATFALGIIQGLAGGNVLSKFDYLSTVSGGGYIGGWLSSWVRRHPDGIEGVERDLAGTPGAVQPDYLASEPRPVRHLRDYSNYLTPRLGLLSADTWTMVALYLRNLLLNWLMIVPLLTTLLAAPRAMAWLIHFVTTVNENRFDYVVYAALASLSLAFTVIGLSRPLRQGASGELPFLRRLSADTRFLMSCIVPLLLGSIALAVVWSTFVAEDAKSMSPNAELALAILPGAAILLPWLIYNIRLRLVPYEERRESADTAAVENQRVIGRGTRELIAATVSAVVGIFLLGVCSWLFEAPTDVAPQLGRELPFLAPLLAKGPSIEAFICFSVPLILIAFFVQASIFVGISSTVSQDYDREWWGRAGAWLIVTAAAWALCSAIVVYGPVVLFHAPMIMASIGGISGIAGLILGKSTRTPANAKQEVDGGPAATARNVVAALIVPIFVVIVLSAISLVTTAILQHAHGRVPPAKQWIYDEQFHVVGSRSFKAELPKGQDSLIVTGRTAPQLAVSVADRRSESHFDEIRKTTGWDVLGLLAVSLIAVVASFCINVNKFSMHAFYRNRLIRAYLGASRYNRDADRFTGFDPHDNLQMHQLRPEMLWASSFCDADGFMREVRKAPRLDHLSHNATPRERVCALIRDALLGSSVIDGGGWFPQIREWLRRTAEVAPDAEGRLVEKRRALCASLEARWTPRSAGSDRFFEELNRMIADDDLENIDCERVRRQKPSRILRFLGLTPVVDGVKMAQRVFIRRIVVFVRDLTRRMADLGHVEQRIRPNTLDSSVHEPALVQDTVAYRNRRVIDELFPEYVTAMPPRSDDVQAADAPETHTCCATKPTTRPPLPIVNVALNLVTGEKLAWQQRKAASFTISPIHAGSLFVGYRDARDYGGQRGGVSVGTAITISGAAASPNMGYHSSPALAFLMTLFNIRLGWWLGNPGRAGDATYMKDSPPWTLGPLTREAAGMTNDAYKWVYLSDGGHFENLGLYEMVLRRAHRIVVSDAGCDPSYAFEDLGNAIRKIRIDFGIPITIDKLYMYPRGEEKEGKYCAIGEIDYKAVDGAGAENGQLLYLKPGVYRDENFPKDVYNYARQSASFPHETTANQFFTESQFESYRALGRHVIDEIAGRYKAPAQPLPQSIPGFIKDIEDRFDPPKGILHPTPDSLDLWFVT